MGKHIAGEIHEFWFQYSHHIGCLPDARIVVSPDPIPRSVMLNQGATPVLVYVLSARAFPPDLPEITYCLLSSALHPLLPSDALTLFWWRARLLFGVPNTLVLHKDILRSYPSVHQLCQNEGVLPEVFLQEPTSTMHKRLQQCSFHAASMILDNNGCRQDRQEPSLSILDCNDSLLDMPLLFRSHEPLSPLSVTAISPHMAERLHERITAKQKAVRPGPPARPVSQEIFPPPADLFGGGNLVFKPARRLVSIGSSGSQDLPVSDSFLEK